MRKNERGLSMNRTFGVPALAGPDHLKAGLQTRDVPRTGSWAQCMRKSERGLSMNRNFQIRITNDEIQRNTEIGMKKPPSALLRVVRPSSFGFLSSFVIRHSSFNSSSPIFERASAFFELLRRDKNHGAFFALLRVQQLLRL